MLRELQQCPGWAEMLHVFRAMDGLSLLLTGAESIDWPEWLAVAIALEIKNVEKLWNVDTGDEMMESIAAAAENVFNALATQVVKETA